jgi:tetratricopeptide (TPR) repeat protein
MSLIRKLAGLLTGAPPAAAGAPPGTGPHETAAEWKAQGNRALAAGDIATAAQCYRSAVAADPADPLARLNLGFTLLESGESEGAEAALLQAIALRRDGDDFLHEAQFLLGQALWRRGETAGALARFEAAIASNPQFAQARDARVLLLSQLGRHAEVLEGLKGDSAPSPDTELARAQALYAFGRHGEALASLDALLAVQPGHVKALEGRGNVMLHLARPAEAVAAFERAIAIGGATAQRLSNLAAALQRLGRLDAALEAIEQAIGLEPAHRDALYNRGNILLEMLRAGPAVQALDAAMALYPHDEDMRWNRAYAHLLLGQFKEGWADYEARWHASVLGVDMPRPELGRPYWSGRESLEGRTVLLFAEQGLGDAIQFLRFVPAVAARASAVVLHVPAALAPLACGLAPNCEVVADTSGAIACDYVCSLLSLPLALGTTLETLPRRASYLRADPARVAAWRRRLDETGASLRVGVVWSGNPDHRNDANRSIPLSLFREIDGPGCRFVSLQPQVRAADRPALDGWDGLLRWGEELRDFADTAALVSALDLVVSVDTSVAHLAGALGRPVWVLVPHYPDWRWLLEREDSPWYPSARLLRQDAPREWGPVLERVRQGLRDAAAQPRGRD